MTNTAAARTATGRYVVQVDDQVIEFNHKRAFSHLVIGRCVTAPWSDWQRWTVFARTNQPRGAEQKWTDWARRQVDGREVEVLVIPVEH